MATEEPITWKAIVSVLGLAISGIAAWAWGHTHKRIDGKADAKAFEELKKTVSDHSITKEEFKQHVHSDERMFESLLEEQRTQRGHIGKIFDKLSESEEKAHNRYDRLMDAINNRDRK